MRWGWAGFGFVLAEDVDLNYIYVLSWIKLPRTASGPLVIGIPESDNHYSSFGQQQNFKSHTNYVYRDMIRMIALRSSNLATTYHDTGSRVKHCKTGVIIRPLTMIFLHEPTPRLTKSFVHFQVQSFVLLKFEEPAFGVPKTK